MAIGKSYIVYTVVGQDSIGRFEIQRRYKEFYLLRQVLLQRHPGLYVPPIPPKRRRGNTDQTFVEERCFYLNMFFKQLVRCPYLLDSDELRIFIRPNNEVERDLTYIPKLSI
jgi:sorting nexin-1/2